MATHELKCEPRWFQAVLDGDKTFEVRRDDRGFQAGDRVRLQEWSPRQSLNGYTGREFEAWIGFVFRQGFGVDLGEYVVFSLVRGSQGARG